MVCTAYADIACRRGFPWYAWIMRQHSLLAALVVSVITAGCGSISDGDSAIDATASGDGRDEGQCCKPDPSPGCCMNYGGWTDGEASGCALKTACDGMPVPSDPAWKLVKDDHGCMVWSSEGATGPRCGMPFDTGVDTGRDATEVDASDSAVIDSTTTSDADASDGDEVGWCCPPDPAPGCCMHYGGWWSHFDVACPRICDGMPPASDPAWHIVKDSHGCDMWSSEGSTGPACGFK
jgi:hypothetical protein